MNLKCFSVNNIANYYNSNKLHFFLFIFIVFILIFLLRKIIKLFSSKHQFGLAEGPATTIELRQNEKLRQSYIEFQNIMYKTLSEKYKDIKVIAGGGMGIIVSAYSPILKKIVAIKTLSPKLHKNPQAIKFFFQECQAIQRMNHPNIIRIYDSADEGFLYYVMEFLEGETLEEKLFRDGVLSVEQIVRIGAQVVRALQHCHSNGIIHRDIKPSNIFITSNNICKILDFGVVKMMDSQVHETGAIGSPQYASPEQLLEGEITGKSDVYALGVCLFKMSCGQFPYENDEISRAFNNAPKNLRKINSSIPEELSNLILECVKVNPQERIDAHSLWVRLRSIKI